MLVDANLLLFATDERSGFHDRALAWLNQRLNGPERLGLPWLSLSAFVRMSTNPRASTSPLTPDTALRQVRRWLEADVVWTPGPTHRHAEVFGGLVERYQVRGNLVTDAELAAIAIEHGLALASADTDFARFRELTWVNPIA